MSHGFRDYWRSYAGALGELGYDVAPFIYKKPTTGPRRWHNKLRYQLPDQFGTDWGARSLARRITRDARAFAAAQRFDMALVIKGDDLEEPFWEDLAGRRIPTVLYLYDELCRMRHTPETLRYARHIATYSRKDTDQLAGEGFEVTHLPMFFDPHLRYSPVSERALVFVGARYPQRERILSEMAHRGLPVVAYGRDWSRRLIDRAGSFEWHRPPVHGRPDVSLAESYGIAAGAPAAVNMHGGFEGFNGRTFEICGVGGLQLIDRSDVTPHYEPGREILVYSSDDELEMLTRRALTDRSWSSAIRRAAERRTRAEHTCMHRCRVLESLW